MTDLLRLATRKSPMAMVQAEWVQRQLQQAWPDLRVEIVPVTTQGDQILDKPLADIGGKGLFIKGLEQALLEGYADIAVHSVKDVPAKLEPPFALSCVLPRPSAADALVSVEHKALAQLPQGAVIGSCSPRRQGQLLAYRPDLKFIPMRGNVNTRLAKLEEGQCDALLLSVAGLERLGIQSVITEVLPESICLPALGQGAVGIEVLLNKEASLHKWLAPLNDMQAFQTVAAERSMVRALQGNCHSPIGAHAVIAAGQLTLSGCVAALDGSKVVQASLMGPADDAVAIGEAVAVKLNQQGAQTLL